MNRGGLGARLLVAAWGIPLLLGLTWLGGWWFWALITVIAGRALFEYYRLQESIGARPVYWFGYVAAVATTVCWRVSLPLLSLIIAAIIAVGLSLMMLLGRSQRDSQATLIGILYAPLLAGSFLLIRMWQPGQSDIGGGKWLAICVWGAIWVGDTAAYAGGRLMGRHPLASRISPKKTVEGAVFDLIGSLGFSLLWWGVGLIPLDLALVVGFAAGVFGQFGDLAESAIKREAGVKDSAGLLPGHGGLLDRFDSLFTTAPIVALYLNYRNFIIPQ